MSWSNQTIYPIKFYCQKILPLVYDDSLSYYEALCKIQHKLNEVINNQNNLNNAFEELLLWINQELTKIATEILMKLLKNGQLLVQLDYVEETKTLNMVFESVGEYNG